MKVLIIDDYRDFCVDEYQDIKRHGYDVEYLVPSNMYYEASEGKFFDDDLPLEIIQAADVIFLDHEMPMMKGDELLHYCEHQGIDMSCKRIIGISSNVQSYLKEAAFGRSLVEILEDIKAKK